MGYTLYNKQLTPVLKEIILEFVLENNANPTGIWRDFHCVHRSWRNLEFFVQAGLISEEDIPIEPDARDYPDVVSDATLACPETCCKQIACRYVRDCSCINCEGQGQLDPSTQDATSRWSQLSYFGWDIFTYASWEGFDF